MPWHRGATRIDAEWDADGRCISYVHACRDGWGAAIVALEGSTEPAGRLDGFADADDGAPALGPAGGDISQDSGTTWAPVAAEGFDTLSFAPRSAMGWAAGDRGRIAKLTIHD